MLFRSTFVHVAHPFKTGSTCEGDVICHTSVCAIPVSNLPYNPPKGASGPCSIIPPEVLLRESKIMV